MRTIIAGSREGVNYEDVCLAVEESKIDISVVVSGTANGADKLGERWAKANRIPVVQMPAKWRNKDGTTNRSAGHQRNARMAEYAEALVAIWDGKSKGTASMIQIAKHYKLLVYVLRV